MKRQFLTLAAGAVLSAFSLSKIMAHNELHALLNQSICGNSASTAAYALTHCWGCPGLLLGLALIAYPMLNTRTPSPERAVVRGD